MVRGKERRRKNLAASSLMNQTSSKRPRLDRRERQLSRFYDPLVLLYTLGETRGEHTRDITCKGIDVSYLSRKHLIRRFLCDLAYVCDYDKGGDTVTAIGLESKPHGHVFWIASNSRQTTKTVPFLDLLLTKIHQISNKATVIAPEDVEDLAARCINFATPRIKAYKNHLKTLLRRCLEHLDSQGQGANKVHGLSKWLRSWNDERNPEDLCRFSYQERRSDFMRLLVRLSTEPSYKSNKDAIHHAFSLVRHYIGRLGHHFRAANDLLSCSLRLSDILHSFEVRSVPTPPRSVIPPPDGKTSLESIIVRMLPAKSPDLDSYQRNLVEMDAKHQLSRRFLDNYREPGLKPRVHAEIQVLEHFYTGNLQFEDGDSFIACSKPACFCCLLYFRAHPGQFVEPTSHHKIYLNWRPPDLENQKDMVGENHRRDILNTMTRGIRKEALRQIKEKIPPHAWHPDSLTGITESVRGDILQGIEEPGEAHSPAQTHVGNAELCVSTSKSPKAGEETGKPTGDQGYGHQEKTNHSTDSSVSDCFLDDSETEGGVSLCVFSIS